MPELPEVEALARDLDARLTDRAIVRVDIAAFSCLKTYDPPITALTGGLVDGVTRHGKFLDITEAGTRKSLALYVVRDPRDVEGIARLGPDPLDDAFTIDVLADILQRAGRAQIKGVLR